MRMQMSQDPQTPDRKLKPRPLSRKGRYVREAIKAYPSPSALAVAAGLPPSTMLRVVKPPYVSPNISTLGAVRVTTKIPFPPDLQNELTIALNRRGFSETMIQHFLDTGELPAGVKIQSTGRSRKLAKRVAAARALNDRSLSIELPEGTVTVSGPPHLSPKSMKALEGWLSVVIDTFAVPPEEEEEGEDEDGEGGRDENAD